MEVEVEVEVQTPAMDGVSETEEWGLRARLSLSFVFFLCLFGHIIKNPPSSCHDPLGSIWLKEIDYTHTPRTAK